MNNITPIRSPMPSWGGGGDWGHHDGWVWNGSQWIWPEPPCPPPCPPPQQCGPPSCVSAVAKAQACYDQSQSLYNLVSQVVSDIFARNPGIIPSPPPGMGSGPLLGVTDGSVAQPGQVGEVLVGYGTATIAAGATSTSVSPLVLQPGDWNVSIFMDAVTVPTTANLSVISFVLDASSLQPTKGLPAASPDIGAGVLGSFSTDAAGQYVNEMTFASAVMQFSTAVPGLIVVTAGVSSAPAVQINVAVYARRMR